MSIKNIFEKRLNHQIVNEFSSWTCCLVYEFEDIFLDFSNKILHKVSKSLLRIKHFQ